MKRFIRVDEEQTCPMRVQYFVYPRYKGDEECTYEYSHLFSIPFNEYEPAAEYAMSILKDPVTAAKSWNEYQVDDKNLINDKQIEKLVSIEEILIYQELLMFDEEYEVIDCPEDFIMYVGRVKKDETGVFEA